MPNPLISTLPCPIERGRVKVTAELAVPDWPGVWALGDCALVPDLTTGKFCPPTAQHALRQGKVAAQNIIAYADGGSSGNSASRPSASSQRSGTVPELPMFSA